jgi:hypothetical protein
VLFDAAGGLRVDALTLSAPALISADAANGAGFSLTTSTLTMNTGVGPAAVIEVRAMNLSASAAWAVNGVGGGGTNSVLLSAGASITTYAGVSVFPGSASGSMVFSLEQNDLQRETVAFLGPLGITIPAAVSGVVASQLSVCVLAPDVTAFPPNTTLSLPLNCPVGNIFAACSSSPCVSALLTRPWSFLGLLF